MSMIVAGVDACPQRRGETLLGKSRHVLHKILYGLPGILDFLRGSGLSVERVLCEIVWAVPIRNGGPDDIGLLGVRLTKHPGLPSRQGSHGARGTRLGGASR